MHRGYKAIDWLTKCTTIIRYYCTASAKSQVFRYMMLLLILSRSRAHIHICIRPLCVTTYKLIWTLQLPSCKWPTPSQSIVMCLWSHGQFTSLQLRLIVEWSWFFWTIKHANDWLKLVTSNFHLKLSLQCNVSPITGFIRYVYVRHINPGWVKSCIEVTILSDKSIVDMLDRLK